MGNTVSLDGDGAEYPVGPPLPEGTLCRGAPPLVCDLCGEPITEDNPVGQSTADTLVCAGCLRAATARSADLLPPSVVVNLYGFDRGTA